MLLVLYTAKLNCLSLEAINLQSIHPYMHACAKFKMLVTCSWCTCSVVVSSHFVINTGINFDTKTVKKHGKKIRLRIW